MKTTSKILFSVIGGFLLLTIVYFSVLPFLPRNQKKSTLDGRVVEWSVPDCPYLKIEEPEFQISKQPYQFARANIRITTSSDSAKLGKLILPIELDNCVTTQQKGDTLIIRFSNLRAVEKEKKISLLKEMVLQYYPKTLCGVKNTGIARLRFETFRADTPLRIEAKEEVGFFDSCSLVKLEIKEVGILKLENCKVDTLNLGLDKVRDWWVKDCEIKVENLSASGRAGVYVPRSEAAEVNWYPQGKDAQLEITLSNTPARIRYENKEKE